MKDAAWFAARVERFAAVRDTYKRRAHLPHCARNVIIAEAQRQLALRYKIRLDKLNEAS